MLGVRRWLFCFSDRPAITQQADWYPWDRLFNLGKFICGYREKSLNWFRLKRSSHRGNCRKLLVSLGIAIGESRKDIDIVNFLTSFKVNSDFLSFFKLSLFLKSWRIFWLFLILIWATSDWKGLQTWNIQKNVWNSITFFYVHFCAKFKNTISSFSVRSGFLTKRGCFWV